MRRSTFMAIAAVIAFAFGLGFVLVPAQLIALYGVTLEIPGQWMTRYFGSALIGVAVLTWRGRNAAQGDALRAILLGDFVVALTGLVVSVLKRVYGPGNAFVWADVAFYLVLTVGFGYFLFAESPSPQHAPSAQPG